VNASDFLMQLDPYSTPSPIMMTSTQTLRSDTWPNFLVGVLGAIVFGYVLSTEVQSIIDIRNVALTNCTIIDAQTENGAWAIHVLYTIPSSFHPSPNSTTISILDGTNSNDNYFVNQTFPCYASTRHLHSVMLERQKPGGGTIAGIVIFSLMCLISLILLVSVVHDLAQYWRAYKSSKSKSVGDDMESRKRVSLDSNMTVVASDLVDLEKAKDEDTRRSLDKSGWGGKKERDRHDRLDVTM
jgi:hypothetical protein